MFAIDYRIVLHDYDDVRGESGFFRIRCDELSYGDFFPPEIEMIMGTDWLLSWFEKLVEVCVLLRENEYVALSDVESYNAWLEFERVGSSISIKVVCSEKPYRNFILLDRIPDSVPAELWSNGRCEFSQMCEEVVQKATSYIAEVLQINPQYQNKGKYLSQEQEHFLQRIQKLRKTIRSIRMKRSVWHKIRSALCRGYRN